ncbi:MAG: adenine deaminase, partial [Waddliaceae bacterium]|nr:adenine deaminase [Waddliaceae bacterium]
ETVPFNFFFGASSCVPATPFETAGGTITADDMETLLRDDKLRFVGEMMNFPGVLQGLPDVMDKIAVAKKYGVPIDGHAPGLRGEDAKRYIAAGITTDHECVSYEEAAEKILYGMKIAIREGSAAKDYDALHGLLKKFPGDVMFCSDDKHPDDLVKGHINDMVKCSASLGYDVFDVLRCACVTPVEHYGLPVGLLRKGDAADFIVVDNLEDFSVLQTYIKGVLVADKGATLIESQPSERVNAFNATEKCVDDFKVAAEGTTIRVIEATDGSLITGEGHYDANIVEGNVVSDVEHDILKIAVVNRYNDKPPAVAFIKGFGLQSGAMASSVAHDSHNIVAVGTSDEELCAAINAVISSEGGIAVADGEDIDILPLPVAGIMSDGDGYAVAKKYSELDAKAKSLGSSMTAPFMTLSFMALLVIPELKLSDNGLFDGTKFKFTKLFIAG